MKKRLFSLGICLLLCFSLLPISASADYGDDSSIDTVRYDLNNGYILVQKGGGYKIANNCIIYASPELEGDVVIPESVDDVTIKGIYLDADTSGFGGDAYGFNRCFKITSLTLPGTIKTVSAESLPGTYEKDCTVILSEGIEEFIGGTTLSGSWNVYITKYVFPKTLKVIEYGRMSESSKLSIELDPANPYFTVDSQGLMYTADKKTLVAATQSGEAVARYTIPYGVEKIAWRSLSDCTALTDIHLPDSVNVIDGGISYEGKRLHARSGGTVESFIKKYNENYYEKPIEFVSTGKKLPYTDIGTGWAVPYIGWAFDNKVMTGTTAATFSPNSHMTRGMAVTTLHRISGEKSDYPHPFTDVSAGAYYSEAVSWATENKVVNGISETQFAPGKNITREQLAVMLYRYAQYLKLDTTKRADLSKYSDSGSISAYALEAMQWANAEGIINGRTETTLSPSGITTRAEYAAVLQRITDSK